MIITLGILLIGIIVIGRSIETNFKKFKWFINEPTLYMIRSLTGDRLTRLNYFDFILFDQYKKLIIDRWGKDFRSRIYSKEKKFVLNPFIQNTVHEQIPSVESPWPTTVEDRKEVELRGEFRSQDGRYHDPIERSPDGSLVNYFEKWKASRKSRENLS